MRRLLNRTFTIVEDVCLTIFAVLCAAVLVFMILAVVLIFAVGVWYLWG